MKKTISIKELVSKASKFHVGSPVMVNEKETYVTSIPDGKGIIAGYTVSGDTLCHSEDELKPIPLDDDFFLRHKSIFKQECDMYTCVGNSHILSVTKDKSCIIDAEEYGYVYKHELLYIMKQICNISIPTPDNV